MDSPTTPLIPRTAWDPRFVAEHPAHRVLARAAACFESASDWPPPASWRAALDSGGVIGELSAESGIPISFAPTPPKSRSRRRRAPVELATLYDERIYSLGEVPSRAECWHDFLNMLVWATFPRAKSALNARQRAALRAHVQQGASRIPGARTREQDALSMLDEGGVLVLASSDTIGTLDAILADADDDALGRLVAARRVSVLAFGHALHEHLLSSASPIRALALPIVVTSLPESFEARVTLADSELAVGLSRHHVLSGPTGSPALQVTRALFA